MAKKYAATRKAQSLRGRVPAGPAPEADAFRTALSAELLKAEHLGWSFIDINAGLLHRQVWGFGTGRTVALCCSVMHAAMRPGDTVMVSSKQGKGAMLTIRYSLPRTVATGPTLPAVHQAVALTERAGLEPYLPSSSDERSRAARVICERPGQGEFRSLLIGRYGGRCLVTGCRVLAVLEAAHINPWRGPNDNHPENGLLLRGDVHTLFDHDLLGIEPARLAVEVHPKVAEKYGSLIGAVLRCVPSAKPSEIALRMRYAEFCERLRDTS